MLLLLALLPLEMPVRDTCDVIEVNHFHDEQGRHVFDQAIFWSFNRSTCRYEVRDWRLLKSPHAYPGSDRMLWLDGETFREVRGRRMESWTQYDPELIERATLPKEQRRELTHIPKELLPK